MMDTLDIILAVTALLALVGAVVFFVMKRRSSLGVAASRDPRLPSRATSHFGSNAPQAGNSVMGKANAGASASPPKASGGKATAAVPRLSAADSGDALIPMPTSTFDVTWLTRLTEKFPTILRTDPHPAAHSDRRAGVILQGNLGQTPLHDLLQYLSLGHKSGILELTSGRRTGRVVLKDGKVAKNSYRGKEGLEAIFLMMDLAEGDFEFYEQVLDEPSQQAPLEVVDLIMLWMDRKPKKRQG